MEFDSEPLNGFAREAEEFTHRVDDRAVFALGAYKVRMRSYLYIIEDNGHREILGFHWHPEAKPDVPFPHLHIYEGAGHAIRQEIRDIHSVQIGWRLKNLR